MEGEEGRSVGAVLGVVERGLQVEEVVGVATGSVLGGRWEVVSGEVGRDPLGESPGAVVGEVKPVGPAPGVEE